MRVVSSRDKFVHEYICIQVSKRCASQHVHLQNGVVTMHRSSLIRIKCVYKVSE